MYRVGVLVLITSLLLTACGTSSDAPVASSSAPDAAVVATATVEPVATAAVTPTETPAEATAIPTGVVMTEPTAEPTVESTPEPTAPAPATATATVAVTVTMPSTTVSVQLEVNRGAETATIINSGTAVLDLSGWVLVSVRGDQRYAIPDGTTIPAGGSLVIASGDAFGDLIWTTENMWNNDGDPAQLLNADGVVVVEG